VRQRGGVIEDQSPQHARLGGAQRSGRGTQAAERRAEQGGRGRRRGGRPGGSTGWRSRQNRIRS
jgi:hypothetical protein